MITIKMNFITRLKLTGILTGVRGGEGGLDKLHGLLAIFEVVHFTEKEMEEIRVTDVGNGIANYAVIDPEKSGPEFALKEVKIEDHPAKWLLKELDVWAANAVIEDLKWLDPLREQLVAPVKAEPARPVKKSR